MHSVCFFNAFLRTPVAIFGDDQTKRNKLLLPSIFSRCPQASIIGLCEVWRGFEQGVLTSARIERGFLGITDSQGSYLHQNSGLCLLYDPRKHAVLHHEMVRFKHTYLLDVLANKGFMAVTFQHKHDRRIFHVVLAHLNDGYAGEYAARRVQQHQLEQILRYKSTHFPPSAACLIMGDFNIDLRTNEHPSVSEDLLRLGQVHNTTQNTYHGGLCSCRHPRHLKRKQGQGRVYDYIFTHGVRPCTHKVHSNVFDGQSISDHSMISLSFDF